MKKNALFKKNLPCLLFSILCALMLFMILKLRQSYGLTTDQAIHVSYGQAVLKWYTTFGRDQSFLLFPANTYEVQHGAIFDALVAAAQHLFRHQWDTEALVIGLTGMLGVIGMALCGFELGGWWFALLAALCLWLYPRFFGAIFNNPKDIPATTANIFVLWSVLRLLKYWPRKRQYLRESLLVALCLALAVAIRVTATTWYALLALILAGWWGLHARPLPTGAKLLAELKKQFFAVTIIVAGSCVGIILLWPYISVDPLANFLDAIEVNARYPWNGSVLYQGQMQLATQLPRSFALVWLVIGSPPILLLFALLGVLFFVGRCIRKRALDPLMLIVLISLLMPLGLIVGLHSVLYNGLRQFLFLIPSLILLAVYALMGLFTFLLQRKQTLALAALTLLTIGNFAWIGWDMLKLHPYEYTYFSPLVGGIKGANGEYETDYWNTCQRAASSWLGQHYQEFVPATQQPTILATNVRFQYLPFLPANFQTTQKNADFLIDIAPFKSAQQLSNYQLIHTEGTAGVPFCKVYANRLANHP